MNKVSVKDINVKGKKVLVRVDFNVPLSADGTITDETRILAALPTINLLIENKAKIILCSHLGRPKGQFKKEYSLEPVAKRLTQLLDTKVIFAHDVIGESADEAVASVKDGEVVLLENLRFHKEETDNDQNFAKKLASYADIYVNDAFGTAHRAHASTAGVAQYLPAAAGLLIERELEIIGTAMENPQRPFVAILGGAKIADKIGVIENLLSKVDCLIIGGGMANTFLAAKGYNMRNSLVDTDSIPVAKALMEKARLTGVRILMPIDSIAAAECKAGVKTHQVPADAIPEGCMSLDIGISTRLLFKDEISSAKTVIWNGPMGVAEIPEFAAGTKAVAAAMAESNAITIIGGGDSAAAVKSLGYAKDMTHISTGGGATLEFLEGKELPGVAVLRDKK